MFAAPPTATINLPVTGASYGSGEYITFIGSGADAEDDAGSLTLEWISSIDGTLGSDPHLTTDTLSRGTHEIRLIITDTDAEIGYDTISVMVRGLPEAMITGPVTGKFNYGDTITFTGTGTDSLTASDDGTLTGISLVWTSSISGRLGTGVSLSLDTLDTGAHTITLTVTDGDNETGTDTTPLTINTPPEAAITSPAGYADYNEGDLINFAGTGTDAEDGTLIGNALVWTSGSEVVGTGTPFSTSILAAGTHTITLTVTDNDAAAATDSITISVNALPVATITSPAHNADFDEDAEITFTGTGTDEEDGTLTGSDLVWTSGTVEIGTGTSVSTGSLANGAHTITLTVTDSKLGTGTDTIDITTGNLQPVAIISSPTNGSSFTSGDQIVFQGTGDDDEDGLLSGPALSWTYQNRVDTSEVGLIGTGTECFFSDFPAGDYSVTLTAIDSNQNTGTATVNLTIASSTSGLAVTPVSLALLEGETDTLTISGGQSPYRVFSESSHIATASVSGGTSVDVIGVRQGITVLTITDSTIPDPDSRVLIYVTVTSLDAASTPLAFAGLNQDVSEGNTVTLDGSRSFDPAGGSLSYSWSSTGGLSITLSDSSTAQPTFVAPAVSLNGATAVFRLTVTDSLGNSADDDVSITINDNGISGFPDSVIPFAASNGVPMGIAVTSGGSLTRLSVIDPATVTDTFNMPGNLIYGLIDYEIRANSEGGTAVLGIYLQAAAPDGYRWFQYSATNGWIDFGRDIISGGSGDGAEFSGDRTRIDIHITDNGSYDSDGTDSIINDPSGLGTPPVPPEDDSFCFLTNLFSR